MTLLWVLIIIGVILIFAYHRASILVWTLGGVILLIFLTVFSNFSWISLTILWILFLIPAIILNIIPWRIKLLTRHLFNFYQHIQPKLSLTEREAIAVGTVYWAGDLLSGAPDWKKMLAQTGFKLSEAEQKFLAGPVEELCRQVDDWEITHKLLDLPPEIWQFLKDQGFFAIIIPKLYGGLEFSAAAHSAIITKIATTSVTVATTVAVPNSLGPAELILHYGTEEQKKYYLPRLAKGEEIPCFALTGPEAGSDAAAIPDTGIVCRGEFAGKEIIGIKLNFKKRYITLAPIATVIGLAFKLYDPEQLIWQKNYIGITVALLPANLTGIERGKRHFPLNITFQNGPIVGQDVFIPIDYIIGGQQMAGQGWRMLIECLSVGRGITLPAISAGIKAVALATGAYTRIREQFNVPISYFEGIEEAVARIVGNAYFIDAMRKMTVAAIDRGEKPAVLTAITKYHTTERARSAICDAMDVHGGKGICLGPRNYLGRVYQGTPISITVEGANILTRSLMIFGQGVIRCHPFVLKELNAAQEEDKIKGLHDFDEAITSHLGFVISNCVRSFLLGLTCGYIVIPPQKAKETKRYFQLFTRYSSAFALLADFSLFFIGGNLKRREKISARMGDILSMLFAGSAVLKHYYDQNHSKEDLPLVHWCCQEILDTIEQRFDEVLKNFPNRFIAVMLRVLIFPFGRNKRRLPNDKLSEQLARLAAEPNAARTRLGEGVYLGVEGKNLLGRLEEALLEIVAATPLEKKFFEAKRKHEIKGFNFEELLTDALTKKIITEQEALQLRKVRQTRLEIIAVDAFDPSELKSNAG